MNPLAAGAAILALGITTQVLAHRLRVPSILLLLLAGFVVGPLTGILDPDALMGDLLLPFVSLSVAIILFEGGLGLRAKEVRAHGRIVFRLVTFGALITGLFAAAGARYLLGLPLDLAILLGAILVVSGPTVVLPLLRHIRPKREVEAVLRWEGILIDPVGAVAAVLLFEAFLHGTGTKDFAEAIPDLFVAFLAGSILGILAAFLWVSLERRYWIPDRLHGAFGVALVVAMYAISDAIVTESGLVTVTIMGMALANQKRVATRHLLDFKEGLTHILLGSLFIILAARLTLDDLRSLEWGAVGLVALLVLVARPVAVWVCSIGTRLSWQERVFIGAMAPRGIVAAAVAAFFSLRLEEAGRTDAAVFVPVTFLVIVSTVTIYGLFSKPLAKALGVAGAKPEGVLFVGANAIARNIAQVLHDAGFRVLLIDDHPRAVQEARLAGLEAHRTSLLSMNFVEEVEMDGIGRLWAVTPFREANALAALRFGEAFGRAKVAQISLSSEDADNEEQHLRGRVLFGQELTYQRFTKLLREGWDIRRTPITEQFTVLDWKDQHTNAYPLFVMNENSMSTYAEGYKPPVKAGSILVALVPPAPQATAPLD